MIDDEMARRLQYEVDAQAQLLVLNPHTDRVIPYVYRYTHKACGFDTSGLGTMIRHVKECTAGQRWDKDHIREAYNG